MEDYLKTLLEQIRCKKAHAAIEEEIRCHIEEQTQDNIALGMSEEEAVVEAVRDMGSPVEAGISLDRIHRTQIAWSLIILMAVISAVGIGIHGLIGNEQTGSDDFASYSIIGFIMMIIVYRLDYSFLATYARVIGGIFLGIAFLGIGTQVINGKIFYFAMGNLHVSIFSFMLLYVPLYGAILYQYYGRGSMGVIKGIIWMLVPVVIALRLPSLSLAIILFVSMGMVLSFAVWKGWFQISKKYFYLIFIGVSAAIPIIFLSISLGFHLLAAYQEARIQAYMGSGEGNYITNLLHTYLVNSQLIGGSSQDIMNKLPDFNTSYILLYLSSSYGLIAAIGVCGVLAFLVIRIFSISLKQKNQLGMMIGCGCGIVITVNIVINILENMTLLPSSQTFLPFFSAGGSSIVVSYIMIGMIMSIYRYKNVFLTHINRRWKKTA